MFKRFFSAMAISVMAMAMSAGVASADTDVSDAKVFSGSFCTAQPAVPTIGTWRGRIMNSGTAGQFVGCPFVRDVVAWGGALGAMVKVVDRHYSEDIDCALWSQNTDSADGWSGYYVTRSSSGSDAGVQTLYFPALSNYSNASSYVMECRIPAVYSGNQSQIVSYQTTEY
jgi:hypothetical protein